MLLPQIIGGLLQEKPKVPEFKEINAQLEQQKAIGANIANAPYAAQLGSAVNQFNQEQLLSMLNKAMPGGRASGNDLLNKSRGVIGSYLKGELPQDVVNQIQRNSAEKSLAGGYGGSGMAHNLTARDLGLTSLQLTQQGLDSASRWLQSAEQWSAAGTPAMFNVSSMFITPQQQMALSQSERNAQFQRDWVKNQLDAEYSLGTTVGRAMIKSDDQIMQIISNVAGSLAGGAGSFL